ncbi:MAG: NAD(P)H-dependent oxidoreductase subunit E, partial [Alphaproteobacteria bacterium]|nr:NAD(P)H-dependent oxidoreductase subunit E [Alphaproteobacteria bacterium]
MADTPHIPNEAETRAKWGDFAWTPENATEAARIIALYPAGRQQSAVMPLLDLAQRQVGADTHTQGWLPVPVMEFIARTLGMAYIRVYEVASFYTMYNL